VLDGEVGFKSRLEVKFSNFFVLSAFSFVYMWLRGFVEEGGGISSGGGIEFHIRGVCTSASVGANSLVRDSIRGRGRSKILKHTLAESYFSGRVDYPSSPAWF
jgi:hypothetical protein